MLSRDDIQKALADGSLKIYPFERKNLTGIGYNLSTTNFAFSINQGILLTIHCETTYQGVKRYVMIPGNDTVLFFSKEYIEVDRTLAGTFHSKVSRVCQGFGHISTTLDPTWKGQLIISVSNPTAREIKFELDKDSGNIMTLLLYKLETEVTGEYVHDNNKGRCDLLLERFVNPFKSKKHREKHLELESFVVKEFADSLNGYDYFLDPDQPQDKYTQKVKELQKLLLRMKKDCHIIEEGRYYLEGNGEYWPLRSDEEKELIQDCVLFRLKAQAAGSAPDRNSSAGEDAGSSGKEQTENSAFSKRKESFSAGEIEDAVKLLEEYISIIQYELDMINHIRRVEWQNEKINQFAGEESELSQARRRRQIIRCILTFWLPLLLLLVGTGAFLYIAPRALPEDNMGWQAASVIYPVVAVPLLEFCIKNRKYLHWRTLK